MNTWKDDMMITSARGRVWSRREVASLCRYYVRRLWRGTAWCQAILDEVEHLLDDATWRRRFVGYVPVAFAREVEAEAHSRAVEQRR